VDRNRRILVGWDLKNTNKYSGGTGIGESWYRKATLKDE
jgi:hypothetical protein